MATEVPQLPQHGAPPVVARSARAADRRAAWPLALAPALAAALSLYQLSDRSLGFDEGATFAIASQHGSALWAAIAHDGGNMSGYYLLLHVLIGAFGHGLWVLRLPSALGAVATVALVGAIAARLHGRVAAVATGVLAAVSLPLVYWAQTARAYAPMVAFACGAWLALIELADPRGGAPPRRWAAPAYAVSMTLAMYCSFVAVLLVPAQLLILARRRAALRRLAPALVAVAVCSLPLVALAAARGSGQLFWVPRPTREVETQVLQSLTSAGLSPSFHHQAGTYWLMWLIVAAVVAAALDAARRARRGEDVWPAVLALSWAVVPAGLTFLWSLVAQPVFVPRNLLASTEAVALVLAPPLVAGRRAAAPGGGRAVGRAALRLLGPAALVALIAARAVPVAAAYGVSPEPWRAVTERVLARARPGDCIAFYPQDARMAFAYYAGDDARAPRAILPVLSWSVVRPYVEVYGTLSPSQLATRSRGCRRMWLVSSHEGEPNGPPAARAHRARWHALAAELARAFGAAPVQRFGYASAIHVQLLPGRGAASRGALRGAASSRRTSSGRGRPAPRR